MLVKALGVLDMLCAVFLIISIILPHKVLMLAALYLIAKGVLFLHTGNLLSTLDIILGILLIFLAFGASFGVVRWIGALYLGQKGLFSML